MAFHPLKVLVGVLLCTPTFKSDDATCPVGSACRSNDHYYWPQARGRPEHPSTSPYAGPTNLSGSLAWTWSHPEGRFHAILAGAAPLIDGARNVYLSTTESIFKFSPDGVVLWSYTGRGRFCDSPSIADGALYAVTELGWAAALDLRTGAELWGRSVPAIGWDIATVAVDDGLMFATVGKTPHGGSKAVLALNASNGDTLWQFEPEKGFWNFLPIFTGNSSLLCQNENGDVFHLSTVDGKLLWSALRDGFGWTDGGLMLDRENGLVLAVHAEGHQFELLPTQRSDISAYRLGDGALVWRHAYPTPPNSWPVVGRIGRGRHYTVLFPYGGQAPGSTVAQLWGFLWNFLPNGFEDYFEILFWLIWKAYPRLGAWGPLLSRLLGADVRRGWPRGVTAFEPSSGVVRWQWELPDYPFESVLGDTEGLWERTRLKHQGRLFGQTQCVPNPWSSPTLDADGRVYLGNQDGLLYVIGEVDGGPQVLDTFQTMAGFSHPGAALAPGMLAIANCDTLFVFRS